MKMRTLSIIICVLLSLSVSAQKAKKKASAAAPATAEVVKEEAPRDTAALREARRARMQKAREAYMQNEEARARELGLDTAQLRGIRRLDMKKSAAKRELSKLAVTIDKQYEEDIKALLGEELYVKYQEKLKEEKEKALNPPDKNQRPQRGGKKEKAESKNKDN